MSGGIREGAGRKPTPIDLNELEKLCAMQCTDQEIAGWLGVSVRTIQNRRRLPKFGEVMRRGKARGSISVRRVQMRLLEAGNVAMAIWLGKNLLGQRDNITAVRLSLPPIVTTQDVDKAAEIVTQAIGGGTIAPGEGQIVMNVLESRCRIFEITQWEGRIKKLEDLKHEDKDAVEHLPRAA